MALLGQMEGREVGVEAPDVRTTTTRAIPGLAEWAEILVDMMDGVAEMIIIVIGGDGRQSAFNFTLGV